MKTISFQCACRLDSHSQATCRSIETLVFPGRIAHHFSVVRPKRRLTVHSQAESGPSEGDPELQEQLVQLLQQGISQKKKYNEGKDKLKEDVRKVVEAEGERLRRVTEEAKLEVDRWEKLMKDRSALEFGSALADINKEADDFEENLRRSRAEMESNQAEFAAWERKVAKDRSQGQFFQKLYQVDKQPGKAGGTSSPAREVQEADSIGATTRAEVRSPLRANIYFFLSLSLTTATVADLFSGDPSYMLDAFYASLAVVLGGSAWSERQLLFLKGSGGEDKG